MVHQLSGLCLGRTNAGRCWDAERGRPRECGKARLEWRVSVQRHLDGSSVRLCLSVLFGAVLCGLLSHSASEGYHEHAAAHLSPVMSSSSFQGL